MISISTITADTSGSVIFKELPGSKLFDKEARVSRTATLDGGVYINHSGYADGDRTLRLLARVTEASWAAITHIFETAALVMVSMSDGVYTAAIESLQRDGTKITLNILINDKESA